VCLFNVVLNVIIKEYCQINLEKVNVRKRKKNAAYLYVNICEVKVKIWIYIYIFMYTIVGKQMVLFFFFISLSLSLSLRQSFSYVRKGKKERAEDGYFLFNVQRRRTPRSSSFKLNMFFFLLENMIE